MTDAEVLELAGKSLGELETAARIRFRLTKTIQELLEDFADSIVDEIKARNALDEPTRLILPIGPVAQYRRVVERSNRERVSWRDVHVFNMDEFLDWQGRPVPLSHPLSFEAAMRRELFDRLDPPLGIPERQRWFPHPFRIDEISERIREIGGIDSCYGGIGCHGHIAFNEPPLSRWNRISVSELRNSLTRVVVLGDDSILNQSVHCTGGCSAAIPPMAVTLGMKDILASRRIRLYCAAGERHRTIFRITVAGAECIEYPSTLVQGHPDAEVVTDAATAAPIRFEIR